MLYLCFMFVHESFPHIWKGIIWNIQNITSILEDLLKDYDKTERPSYKDGLNTNIQYLILNNLNNL